MVLIGGLIGITIAVVIGVNLLPTIASTVDSTAPVNASATPLASGKYADYCAGTPQAGFPSPDVGLFCNSQAGDAFVPLVGLLPLIIAAVIIVGAIGYIANKRS